MSTNSQKSFKQLYHNDSVLHIKDTTDTIKAEKQLKKVHTDDRRHSDMARCSSNNLSTKRSQISKRSKNVKPKVEDLSETMKLYRTDITAAAKIVQTHINEESGGVMHRISIGSTIPAKSPVALQQSHRDSSPLGLDASRSPTASNLKQFQEKEQLSPSKVQNLHTGASSVVARQMSPVATKPTEKFTMPVLRSHLMLNSHPTHASINDSGTQGNQTEQNDQCQVGASFERVKQLAKTGENFNTLKFDPLRPTPNQNSTAFTNNRKKEEGNFACQYQTSTEPDQFGVRPISETHPDLLPEKVKLNTNLTVIRQNVREKRKSHQPQLQYGLTNSAGHKKPLNTTRSNNSIINKNKRNDYPNLGDTPQMRTQSYWKVYKTPVSGPNCELATHSFSRAEVQNNQSIQRRKTKRKHLAKILKGEEQIKEKEDYDSEEPEKEGDDGENPDELRQPAQISDMHMTNNTGFGGAASQMPQINESKGGMQQFFSTATGSDRFFDPVQTNRGSLIGPTTLSKNQVRQNRKKIENDVQRLHNRIQMLQAEEERALHHIEEAKARVQEVLRVKSDTVEKKQELKQSRPSIPMIKHGNPERSQAHLKLDKHESARVHMPLPNTSKAHLMSRKSSKQLSAARLRHEESIQSNSRFMHPALLENARAKAEEAIVFKHQRKQALRMREKLERRDQKFKDLRMQDMKAYRDFVPRERKQQADNKRWNSVRRHKEKELLQEVKKMNKQESQAKKLENLEAKILKRLRDTHSKQQTAIAEINKIFSVNMDDRLAEAKESLIPQNLSLRSQTLQPEVQNQFPTAEEDSGEGEEAAESSSDDEDQIINSSRSITIVNTSAVNSGERL